MKQVILRETKGKGYEHIAFHLFPSLVQTTSLLPTPELFTNGWQRAGLPDLHLNHMEE